MACGHRGADLLRDYFQDAAPKTIGQVIAFLRESRADGDWLSRTLLEKNKSRNRSKKR